MITSPDNPKKLPFRQLDVGEWFERTSILSITEIGVLTYLENCYWRTGELPPLDSLKKAMAMRQGDQQVLGEILTQYFPDGRCPHMDAQRADALSKSKVRSENATKQHAARRKTEGRSTEPSYHASTWESPRQERQHDDIDF